MAASSMSRATTAGEAVSSVRSLFTLRTLERTSDSFGPESGLQEKPFRLFPRDPDAWSSPATQQQRAPQEHAAPTRQQHLNSTPERATTSPVFQTERLTA